MKMYDSFHNELEVKFYREVTHAMNSAADEAIEQIQGKKLDLLEKSVEFEKEQHLGNNSLKKLVAYRSMAALGLTQEQLENLRTIIKDAVYSAVHSVFVSIDGGTALSNNGKAIDLINFETKESLTNGALHESFIQFDNEE